jgi:hypothetical protein
MAKGFTVACLPKPSSSESSSPPPVASVPLASTPPSGNHDVRAERGAPQGYAAPVNGVIIGERGPPLEPVDNLGRMLREGNPDFVFWGMGDVQHGGPRVADPGALLMYQMRHGQIPRVPHGIYPFFGHHMPHYGPDVRAPRMPRPSPPQVAERKKNGCDGSGAPEAVDEPEADVDPRQVRFFLLPKIPIAHLL